MVNEETSQAYWIFIPKKKASYIRIEEAVDNVHSTGEVLPPPGIVLENRYFVNSFESTSYTLQRVLDELNNKGLEPKFD